MNRKVTAAVVSVAATLSLVVAKLVVGRSIGSVSVLSEAAHSAVDLAAALVALFSVRVASRPADDDHRYGHGKIENLSALAEGVLVLLAAVWIVTETWARVRSGEPVTNVSAGLWVMAVSVAVNWGVSRHLYRVAKEEESAALEADALHLRTDIWTSLGVLVGLLLVRFTGIVWLDAATGMTVGLLIARAGWDFCRHALMPLIDARLPEEEEQEIIGIIEGHSNEFVEFHDLRTRRGGAERYVDFHLVVHGQRSLEEVHRLCDEIEEAILHRFPRANVLIHPEPCESGCDYCQGQRQGRRGLKVAPGRIRLRSDVYRRQSDSETAAG